MYLKKNNNNNIIIVKIQKIKYIVMFKIIVCTYIYINILKKCNILVKEIKCYLMINIKIYYFFLFFVYLIYLILYLIIIYLYSPKPILRQKQHKFEIQ